MKYIIEIEDEPFESPGSEHRLWKSTEFNSLVFDKTGLEKLTPYDESAAEQRGQEEAWELARKIAFNQGNIREILLPNQPDSICCVFDKFSYAEAREKCDSWEKQKDIKVGDEVIDSEGIKAVVLDESASGESWGILDENGLMRMINKSKVSKTNRHFPEVADLLEKMRETEC